MCLRTAQKAALAVALLSLGIFLCTTPAFAAAAPSIRSISPGSGTSNGGTVVTILGANFQAGATVTIGGLPLAYPSVQSGSIQGITPAHLAGGADIVVTNPDGQHTTVKALLHNQGFEAGSAQWILSGTGSATVVNSLSNAHNGTYYAELNSSEGEKPQFFAASGEEPEYFPVRPGDVLTFGGWAYRVSGDGRARWAVEISDAEKRNPIYIGAAPSNVGNAQWELQQTAYTVPAGMAFVRLYCEIAFNTVPAVARFDDAILNITPGGIGGYTFISPPLLISIAPDWGAPAGGTTRTVYGTGFANGDKVFLGDAPATNVVVNSANAITFFAPANSPGVVNVTVTAPDGDSSSVAEAYAYKTPPAPPSGMNKIHHIVYQLQENRSFDDYFGLMNQYRANHGIHDNAADGLDLATALPDLAGQPVKPFHMRTGCTENTQPSWNAAHLDYDNGKMDGFMKTGNYFAHSSIIDPNGTRAMGYYDWNDVPYYYALAFNFATNDQWFSSMMGPTGSNRAYSVAATSLGWVSTPQPPEGGFPNLTIFDLLNHAGVSWKYYYQNEVPTWIPEWSVFYKDRSRIVPLVPNYYNDVMNDSTLPEVVFIEEHGDKDEHPKPDPGVTGGTENIQNGPQSVSTIVSALMESPSWRSSVFILTWDESGGTHDHVVPPAVPPPDGYGPRINPGFDQPGMFNQTGFRVPVIVISPWTGPHQVSHIVRDHTSILKLIETRFSLPPLTARDAAADDMAEFFNFSSPPWLTPPSLPVQPTNGTCDLNLETAP
jgi:phospholipase C